MKTILTTILLLFTCYDIYSQYKEQLLEMDESKISKLDSYIYDNDLDEVLTGKVKDFSWDFNDITFYQKFLEEIENEKLDYRYFLFLSKISNIKESNNNYTNRVYYYYKLKFAILAIENGKNLAKVVADSIKKQIIEKYYTASFVPNVWQDDKEFKNYAEFVLKYIDNLKYSTQFDKKTISLFYQTKADIIYEIYILTEGNNTKISEVLTNYKMALSEDNTNWKAFVSRGKLRFYRLNDYRGALEDYKEALSLENKKKFPLSPNLTTFSFEIGECYLKLKKYSDAINFYNKTNTLYLGKIKEPNKKIRVIDKEIYTKYIGIFYFKLANCYYNLKNKKEACGYFKKSLTFGYSPDNLRESMSIFNCN
ncbi:tetratricopeptide repeat protein [Ferruginibacter sp.]